MMNSSWKHIFLTILALFVVVPSSCAVEQPLVDSLQEKYDALTPRGKFIAGAAVGFVGSRIAIKTLVGAVKVGAAAFITTEVLHFTGVIDKLPDLSDEQEDLINKMKSATLRQVDGFRVQVRRRLSPDSIQGFFDKEKMCALGLAGGAFIGTVL